LFVEIDGVSDFMSNQFDQPGLNCEYDEVGSLDAVQVGGMTNDGRIERADGVQVGCADVADSDVGSLEKLTLAEASGHGAAHIAGTDDTDLHTC